MTATWYNKGDSAFGPARLRPFYAICQGIFTMGKMKQLTLATLLAIIALSAPGIAGAGQSNQFIGSGDSTPDSEYFRYDSMGITALKHLVANANGEDSLPSFSRTPVSQSQDAGCNDADSSQSSRPPRWTISAESIILDRVGGANRTLVERVPGIVSFSSVPTTPGTQALNSNDFQQGFSAGPRIGLIYHGDSGFDLELSYFQVDGWSTTGAIGPDNPPDWLVMRAPGSFFQTQDFTYQAMEWDYATELYNAEFNVRWNLSNRVTMLAGFRWLQLTENLQGTLAPVDRIQPLWKLNQNNNLFDVAQIENLPGVPVTGGFPPFWNTSTTNNLYGLQIGADGKIFERGRFSIGGLIKVGGYCNNAEESTGVSIFKVVRPSHASTNHAAFVGEAGLQCKYQVIKGLALKVGYEALWLEGVALAPGQIQETYTTSPATVTALGVNSDSGVFFHGPTAGLEYSF